MGRPGWLAAALAACILLAGCTDQPPSATRPTEGPTSQDAASTRAEQSPFPRVSPDNVRGATAMRAVQHLAGEIGPRPGHTRAYFRAAGWVQEQLVAQGWRVQRQRFPTPGGVSWGVPVDGGPSVNLIATRDELRPNGPWLVVGAHLDTVPQAPGAEDNASGIGVLLAIAEALRNRRTRMPVVLVAFGSEEPRGLTDDDHHYGSRAYVETLDRGERRGLRGMVSLDRVGVGSTVPVGSPDGPTALSEELLRAARRAGVDAVPETGQRSSDHWSFARAGLPGVRLGGNSYGAYHSPADTPDVVDRRQLERVARLVLAWLR